MHFLTSCQLTLQEHLAPILQTRPLPTQNQNCWDHPYPGLPHQAIDIPSHREGVERLFQPHSATQLQLYVISGALESVRGRRLTEGASICSAAFTGMDVSFLMRWHTWGHLCNSLLMLLQISLENLLVHQGGLKWSYYLGRGVLSFMLSGANRHLCVFPRERNAIAPDKKGRSHRGKQTCQGSHLANHLVNQTS